MKNTIIVLLIGIPILIFFFFAGLILFSKLGSEKEIGIEKIEIDTQSPYLNKPKIRCYFTSTFGDVTKEEELNCDYYEKYYKSNFNTIHVDSLPHGFIK